MYWLLLRVLITKKIFNLFNPHHMQNDCQLATTKVAVSLYMLDTLQWGLIGFYKMGSPVSIDIHDTYKIIHFRSILCLILKTIVIIMVFSNRRLTIKSGYKPRRLNIEKIGRVLK